MAASGGVSKRAEQRVERGKSEGRYSEERRVVQLEDPRRHDRMREFNFLGLSIISSARGPSSPPAYFSLSLRLLSLPSLISDLLAGGSRFVIPANGVPFFQRHKPVFSSVIRPHPQKSSSSPPPPSPLFLLSQTVFRASYITHEVIKISQGDNFSNAAYTDFP